VTISSSEPDALLAVQAETRSLLRALLLGTMIERPAEATAASRALTRLELGTYGTCQGCTAPISLDVLLAAPQLEHCHDCSSDAGPAGPRRHVRRRLLRNRR
jgi:RNA polymerase-binding transcription factor DksA